MISSKKRNGHWGIVQQRVPGYAALRPNWLPLVANFGYSRDVVQNCSAILHNGAAGKPATRATLLRNFAQLAAGIHNVLSKPLAWISPLRIPAAPLNEISLP